MYRNCCLVIVLILVAILDSNISSQATGQTVKKIKCITNHFESNDGIVRYFKGFMYAGMLGECQMAAKNKAVSQSYILHFKSGLMASAPRIVQECRVSPSEFVSIMASYAAGMRLAGGLSIWRLVERKEKRSTCAAILLIVKNKLE